MASSDTPPNSRLFILCQPSLTANDVKNTFDRFGEIEDCWVVYDQARKSKGICFVKFSKASEACRAMEEMDNRPIGNEPRPIKIKMACPVSEGKKRESDAECFERLRCAFIRVPSTKAAADGKPYTEESITNEFAKYGNIVNCHITRSRRNCYVTFEKPSQAASAIEECDRDFAAVFVDPEKSSLLRKGSRDRSRGRDRRRSATPPQDHVRRPGLVPTPSPSSAYPRPSVSPSFSYQYGRYSGGILTTPGQRNGDGHLDTACQQPSVSASVSSVLTVDDYVKGANSLANNPSRCREIYLKINYPLSRENAYRLCNLVPGLEMLEWVRTTGESAQLHTIFLVRYASPASASWAWEKLQDLEYPPGSYVRVRYADGGFPRDWDLSATLNTPTPLPPAAAPAFSNDYSALAAAQMEALQSRLAEHTAAATSAGMSGESSILTSLVNTLSAAVTSSPIASSTPSAKMYPVGRAECSVKLSYPKAMLPKSTPYEARLFFLCTKPITNDVLEDAFSSFGDLINVHVISGKNCGYLMYASKRAAEEALATMNNATLAGSKLKMLPADPEPPYKRANTENA